MFHYDQSLQQNDEFRCTQKEPLSSSWVNINGINFCSGGWQRYLFGLKAELGFKSDAEENYVLIEDPLLRLFDIWDIIFNKQVRLFRHQRRVYLSWLGNTVVQVANSGPFGCKGGQNWEYIFYESGSINLIHDRDYEEKVSEFRKLFQLILLFMANILYNDF